MLPPPQNFLPVLHKLKAAYFAWFESYSTLAKVHRFTIGRRVDDLLVECVEAISAAGFAEKPDKISNIRLAVRKLDCNPYTLTADCHHALSQARHNETSLLLATLNAYDSIPHSACTRRDSVGFPAHSLVMHASADENEADKEIAHWFSDSELVEYESSHAHFTQPK